MDNNKNKRKSKRTDYHKRHNIGVILSLFVVGLLPILSYSTDVGTTKANQSVMNLTGKSNTSEDTITLNWDEPDQTEPYTYQVYSKKPNTTEFQTISATDLNKEVKVLNVYPEVESYITYKTHDGTIRTGISKSASLEMWMEEPNSENSKGYGMGLIDVEPVGIRTFRDDPYAYLKDAKGEWKYDVVMFGSWDATADSDLSAIGVQAIREFHEAGRGVLFGHDNIYYGKPNFKTLSDMVLINHGELNASDSQIKVNRTGLLTNYPYELDPNKIYNIPYTHTTGLSTGGDVWFTFKDGTGAIRPEGVPSQGGNPFTREDGRTNNFYLATWNNASMIQTGHLKGESSPDEQKILANTLFYLAQLTTETNITDRSAMEVYPPEFKNEEFNVTRSGDAIAVDFSDAEDVESTFEYYIEATGQNTGVKNKSETIKVTNTSGFAGYSTVIDSNATTIPDNKVDTTESKVTTTKETGTPKYLHVVAVDKKGNISEPLHIKLDDTKPKISVTKGTEDWINTEVTLTINMEDSGSGLSRLYVPSGGYHSLTGESTQTKWVTVSANGNYELTVEDKAGNKETIIVPVTNIDKNAPGLTVNKDNAEWTNENVQLTATGKDPESGIKNVRMTTDNNSKNIVTMSDLQAFYLDGYERQDFGYKIKVNDKNSYGGLMISDKLVDPKEWYVLSFDMTKLSGDIPIIGGHAHIANKSEVYIDGERVSGDVNNPYPTGVDYPNDNKKHHVAVVLYTGNYDVVGNKNLYIQPNRGSWGKDYEAVIENVQFEKGAVETPYEPNYKDLLTNVNPLKVNVSENGTYTFTTTDNAGNEYEESIEVTNIDKTPPELELSLGTYDWVNKEVVIDARMSDKDSKLNRVEISNGVTGANNYGLEQRLQAFRVQENGEYTFTLSDIAGNTTTKTITVNNIDKEKPKLKLDYTPKGWTNKNIEITATGEDTQSGVQNVRMTTDLNSKNIVTMGDLQGYNLSKYEKKDLKLSMESLGESKFGGVQLPEGYLNKDGWNVLSFDMTKLSGNITHIGGHAFVESETYIYIDGELVRHGRGNIWTESVPYPNDNKKHHVTVVMLTDEFGVSGNDNLYIQPNRNLIGSEYSYKALIENLQFEHGDEETPYEPNYKDLLTNVNPLKVNVSENGKYTFTATDIAGNEYEESIEISNIDKTTPSVKVTGNPTDYTEEETVTLNIQAEDNGSGVSSITLPDGKVVSSTKAPYTVNVNGSYEFVVTDNAGNTTTETLIVDKMMVPYTFYLFDAKGKPLEGAGFDLMRDGVKYTESVSDSTGLVNFGKVPPTGRYTIKQTKAPDGYVVSPDEKDVEVGDTTEPEEFISYPRGEILPATGKVDYLAYITVVGLTLIGLVKVGRGKKKATRK